MIDWKERTVLVTGASGFIGKALCKGLFYNGAKVIAHGGTSRSSFIAHHVVTGDICDISSVREAISRHGVTDIFHLAAYSIVQDAAKDPLSTYRVNVMGTVNVLEAARNVGGIKSIVVASSDKAYGEHDIIPYREDFPLQPKNTYDVSKACADLIARSFGSNYGMPVCVTRCSNVYGPGDPNSTRIIPNTIRRVLAGIPPMIYSDIAEMQREFIYIDDVVDALLELGGTGAYRGDAFNIGRNEPVEIRQMLKSIAAECGRQDLADSIVVHDREPNFKEIQRQAIDPTKLFQLTGWRSKFPLITGLQRTIESYR